MTLQDISQAARTDVVPVGVAAEHYMQGTQRGQLAGQINEHRRIIDIMKSDEFRDYVWSHWKSSNELYDVMIEYIESRTPKPVRSVQRREEKPISENKERMERLERSYLEADLT